MSLPFSLSSAQEEVRVEANPDRMRCKGHPPALIVEHTAGNREPRKNAVTAARREQNRRAQRAFRKRKSAKKRFPQSTTPRLLAPCPPEVELDFTVRSCETEILDLAQNVAGQDTPTPSSSDQGAIDGLQDQQRPSSCTTKEAALTFSSPQTLFPALVPKRCSPYAEFLKFTTDRPSSTLWPHGVTATLAACLFNARALGIDIGRVLDPNYMSPFYRPSYSLVLPSGSGGVQPTNPDVASDPHLAMLGPLRPCFAQVIFPHQACIDLLPLPRLRETAVMLHTRAQREGVGVMSLGFDGVQELKKDVYVRQGVRFRGTGELRGDEYIMHDDSERHCGHPWERGSWAIAAWFATKWKYLVEI